jgi:hypothetical protein
MEVLPEWYAYLSDDKFEYKLMDQSDPGMIKEIMAAVSIPVMAKVRIGHFVEAQILQAVGVDYIDVRPTLSSVLREMLTFRNPRSLPWLTTSTTSASTNTRYLSFVVARTWERLSDVSLRVPR